MAAASSSGDSPGRILIVDDVAIVCRTLADNLRAAGYDVSCAHGGVEGVKKFQEEPWDLVVTDRAMPDMDGEEMARAIKSHTPDVPIIMITGLLSGVRDWKNFRAILPKPFKTEELLALVESIMLKRPVARMS